MIKHSCDVVSMSPWRDVDLFDKGVIVANTHRLLSFIKKNIQSLKLFCT